MAKGRRGTPNRPKDNPKQDEIAEFAQFIQAIQNTADIPGVLDRNIGIIDRLRSGIEGDKNKHQRFKAFLRFQEEQEYYSRKKMESDEAKIEDTRRKISGEYDWPEEGENLMKKTRPKLNEYAIKLNMDPDEVMAYKTKGDLVKAIEKGLK